MLQYENIVPPEVVYCDTLGHLDTANHDRMYFPFLLAASQWFDGLISNRNCVKAKMVGQKFDSVICFGDSDWWYHNRSHADMQFMRRFARNWPTLYVNSLGVRKLTFSNRRALLHRVGRKARSIMHLCCESGEGFRVASPVFLPGYDGRAGWAFAKLLRIQLMLVMKVLRMQRPLIWVACPSAASVLDELPRAALVYQLSDAYTALDGGPSRCAGQMEARIVRRADVIICSSERLVIRARNLYGRTDCTYVDHGVDFDVFSSAGRRNRVPPALTAARRPIIGFYGNMDENTVDRLLLQEVIRSRPQYQFVLVGSMALSFEVLKRAPNVIAIPQQPYPSIADYGAAFDVCLMPWLQNEWIRHCNPIKLKEYLALGKPVVSTPYPELGRCGTLCYEASGADHFASAIDQALRQDGPVKRMARREWASQHSWDEKFNQVRELLIDRRIGPGG